jgi:hypothetical protein
MAETKQGRGFRGGGRRGRGQSGRGSLRSPRSVTDLDSNSAVPMLRYGNNQNLDLFERKMIVACLEKYGNLGRLIQDGAYYDPPAVDEKSLH